MAIGDDDDVSTDGDSDGYSVLGIINGEVDGSIFGNFMLGVADGEDEKRTVGIPQGLPLDSFNGTQISILKSV